MEALGPADPSYIAGYRLLRRLGAGGMGVVYLGRSPGGSLLAIKVILADRADEPSFRARFRREVAAARRVSSPWTAAVTDADTESEAPWLATEYVPGPALGEAVASFGPLAEPYARQLGARLCEALGAVHAADLVHRDVKPGNILFALDGPRLIDFGIARSANDTALTGLDMVIGSPGFLSPEQAQARGPGVGPASDVFSLGCVLAFATSGRRPFGTGSPAAMLYRTVHGPADMRGVPDGLLALLTTCLAKDPAHRPGTQELREHLTAGLAWSGHDTPWLPRPVIRLIAERSAAMLALPGIDATVVSPSGALGGASAQGERAHAPGGGGGAQGPSRRRWLTAASAGGVLAVSGGIGAWAALRGGEPATADTRAASGPRYTLAVHADLSGPGAALGRAQERGAQLAVAQFNAREDRPFTLALRVVDDGGSPDRAKSVARRLCDDPKVLAVIGPTSDETLIAVAPTYSDGQLAVVSVSVGTDKVTHLECRSYLASRPSDGSLIVPLLAHVAHRTRPRDAARGTVVGLIDDRNAGEHSWKAIQGMHGALRGSGLPTPPRTVTIPRGSGDVRSPVAELLAAKVDAVMYGGLLAGAIPLAKELHRVNFQGDRLALQPALEPAFLRRAGAAANGWLISSCFTDATAHPQARPFAAAYRQRYGAAPPRYAAEAYDVVGYVARGLRELGVSGAERESLVRRLPKVSHQGVTKEIRFEPDTAVLGDQGLFLFRVDLGRFRFLGEYRRVTGAGA
ncbi:bifunctional serine/threonine-protein kinase/ABC transporter substrate-binding protein [Streptomyces zagrosensis]|uniref:ABC-type branched-subunit amino acid transport system substrate-binding protein n=1 Tax=Streptomyces zagrosensis TaxID=1042984 RepID=A0A7W9V074_9ACTN|nr:bifunctional serine/threonine-protein kinase/ABC transporter substrate-binding protein [Streptomyces zagrosensis]MBB5937845.1 ABC-type branched-subunit amino acid transport system substrate-binding protein [Streptomyces zagrosensis]